MLRNYLLCSQVIQKSQLTVNNLRYLKYVHKNFKNNQKKKSTNHENVTLDMVKNMPNRIETEISSETKLGKMLKNLENSMDNSAAIHTFESEIEFRRDQAKRSIMFKLPSNPKNIRSLVQRLIGTLENDNFWVQNISLQGKKEEPYVLIEFDSRKSVEQILSHKSTYFKGSGVTPTSIRILYFPGTTSQNYTNSLSKHKIQRKIDIIQLESKLPKTNLSNQIQYFYDVNKIEDADYRIRYFVASLIDESIGSLFKNVVSFPFGSSGNKFGSKTSDLDLGVLLDGYFLKEQKSDHDEEFYYLSKKNDDLKFILFDVLTTIITNVLPRFKLLQKIRNAKVPILKVDVSLGEVLNCDISISQLESSVLMTKLFWTYGQFDSRVAPLVFMIRYWAKMCKITSSTRPSPKLTNYQITMLVLHYLINMKEPLLIPIDNFVTKQIVMKDKGELAEKLRKTVIAEVQILKDNTNLANEMNLQELSQDFFKFYSKFNFENDVVSVTSNSVNAREAYDHNCIFIENPFDCEQNASRNVSKNELSQFKNLCLQSENLLQSGDDKLDLSSFLNHIQKTSFRNGSNGKTESVDDMLIREMHDY